MLIPKNVVADVELRPDRVGPVFRIAADGHVYMHYRMRKRNAVWKDDPPVKRAVAWLEGMPSGRWPDCLTHTSRATLQPGWRLIRNKALHDRSIERVQKALAEPFPGAVAHGGPSVSELVQTNMEQWVGNAYGGPRFGNLAGATRGSFRYSRRPKLRESAMKG